MLKKEKPMMTVAAIIEQAQSRWMDQHPLQVYNRAFQGSYCKYYCILLFVYSEARLFLHHPIHSSIARVSSCLHGVQRTLWIRARARERWKAWICVIQLCAHDNIRKNVGSYENVHVWWPQFHRKFVYEKGNFLFRYYFFSKWRPRSITSANKISIESQFVRCASCPTGSHIHRMEAPSTTSLRMAFR